MAKGLWPVINVSSVEKTVEFYKGLGLKATLENADMPGAEGLKFGMIDQGEWGLIMWDKNAQPADQPADTRAWLTGELGKGVLFTVGVPNAAKTWENAKKIRADVDTPLEKQPWGGLGFNVTDPDGYVLNITDKFPEMTPAKPAKRAKATKVAKKATKASKTTKAKKSKK